MGIMILSDEDLKRLNEGKTVDFKVFNKFGEPLDSNKFVDIEMGYFNIKLLKSISKLYIIPLDEGIIKKEIIREENGMKKKNLKIISGISQDIVNKMISHESNENEGIVILPRTILNEWQRVLFEVVVDETKENSDDTI